MLETVYWYCQMTALLLYSHSPQIFTAETSARSIMTLQLNVPDFSMSCYLRLFLLKILLYYNFMQDNVCLEIILLKHFFSLPVLPEVVKGQ